MNTPKTTRPKPTNNDPKASLINGKIANNEEWFTTEDVIRHLKISRSSLYRLRTKQLIPSYKLGGTIVYPKSLINKLLLNKSIKNIKYEL